MMKMSKNDFIKWPAHATLSARTSTISNAFVQSFTPWLTELDEDEKQSVLQLYINNGLIEKEDKVLNKCVYCGKEASSADHFHPLVREGVATGHITEIYNLVPCCDKCNSSKGNKTFEEWYNEEKTISEIIERSGWNELQIIERRNSILNLMQDLNRHSNYEKIKSLYSIDIADKLKEIYDLRKQINETLISSHKKCLELYDEIIYKARLISKEDFIFYKLKRFLEDFRNEEKVKKEFLEIVNDLKNNKFCFDNFGIDNTIFKKSGSPAVYIDKFIKKGNKSATYVYAYINKKIFNSISDESEKKFIDWLNVKDSALNKKLQND